MTMHRRPVLLALGLACAAPGAAPAQATAITGTAAYRERIALPPGAVLEVELRDISRADAAADAIATARIPVQGQVPIRFALPYDAARIRPEGRYAVAARLLVDGREAWRSDRAIPVLTQGAGSSAEIPLIRAAAGEAGLIGPTWVAGDIGGAGRRDRQRAEITFTAEGRVHGSGGCNRFTGGYALDGARLRFGQMASTQMACEPEAMEREQRFHAALAEVQGWRIVQDILHLTDGAGATVLRLSRAG